MGSSSGSTLGLDFSKGRVFADEIYNASGFTVHPMENLGSFTLVVSFSRHDFRLSEDSVAAAFESALGGSAIDFLVSAIGDKVFSFNVSCKDVGFYIVDTRSYSCPQFKCYFHLWGNGGPNWVREFKIWKKECDAEWILVSPSKRRVALGLLAMHNPPAKSALKSGSSVRKKLSFATFQNYSVCKGYRYHASADCIVASEDAGYHITAAERVVIHPPKPIDLQWTVASPPIIFGSALSA
ncbi:uncharacterized protein [Aegilops tauschii subsp. strangulata]|uniref:uncharacterized protein n=1 Tax=Aegilops tauschii subsp. strangulata TaxID=200361 RepID=UPI003CC8CAFD